MNRKLIFERAHREHSLKLRHGVKSIFADALRSQYRIAKLLGASYKEVGFDSMAREVKTNKTKQ